MPRNKAIEVPEIAGRFEVSGRLDEKVIHKQQCNPKKKLRNDFSYANGGVTL
jgi:NAD dependent epimerase/dehydratase family enzyme